MRNDGLKGRGVEEVKSQVTEVDDLLRKLSGSYTEIEDYFDADDPDCECNCDCEEE